MKLTIIYIFILSLLTVTAQEKERKIAFDNYRTYFNQTDPTKDEEKAAAILKFRQYFAVKPYRLTQLKGSANATAYLAQLNDDGRFTDMIKQEEEIIDQNLLEKSFGSTNNEVAAFLTKAYNRIWQIANTYRTKEINAATAFDHKVMKAIVYYGNLEIGRPNKNGRFHSSCFAMPTAAVNIYFSFLPIMDEIESGKITDKNKIEVADMLKMVALQAWTQPFRNDETDKNVVQLERFRNHVWWVGGNALAYRSLLPVAFMYKSVPMVDVLAEVSQKAMSTTSQNTYETSFWNEGFTTDGAGWGHGKQCLIWGYPIDGTSNALSILSMLKGSPWAKKLSEQNVNSLLNYFQGSNWYYYKGHTLPCLDRNSMHYSIEAKAIRTQAMVKTLLKDWKNSFTPFQQAELNQFTLEANSNSINLLNYPKGVYSGTRWFYNNDDLIKKNENYHVIVNMASMRCDGIESATNFADEYNFFSADGLTFFQKTGDEYRKINGGWDVTATPGVTAREGMNKLTPVTNWRGYCSKFNFAGAATFGGDNAVAGFIFEKMNASEKKGVNDEGNNKGQNPVLYGVQVHKAWFMLGDYVVALGAGVQNLKPDMEGTIRTTMDQTANEAKINVISAGKVMSAKKGVQSFFDNGKTVWVQQEGKFAYTVLPEFTKTAYFVAETKDVDWVKMNKSNEKRKDLPATVDILRLWVDHGQQVKDGTYGYVVYCGKGTPAAEMRFKVLQNDTIVQAIQSVDAKLIQGVFYKGNTTLVGNDISLSVSDPCILLVENKDKEYLISVQDPQMNNDLKQITISIGRKKYPINLPQGEIAGKPVVLSIGK
ncbi:MAG: polysaccharide lyase family 8 super-sandwich domain-containing protein [Paludibacter sp.]|nr:polysaccharide lyase family 8 super-sandwich domain-containing protein [Paludibacter sp.]